MSDIFTGCTDKANGLGPRQTYEKRRVAWEVGPAPGWDESEPEVHPESKKPPSERFKLTVVIECEGIPGKETAGESILDAVETGVRGLLVENASTSIVETAQALRTLTARELEVLELVVSGNSNKMTARKLGISPRTVEFHRARLREKTGAKCLPDLVRLYPVGCSLPATVKVLPSVK